MSDTTLEVIEIVHELTIEPGNDVTTTVTDEVVTILEVAEQGPQGIQGPPGSVGPGGGLSNVVEDLSPQLGGDLDLNTKTIFNGLLDDNTLILDGGLL